MALKNRDGTPYKLRGPNPMMKNQEVWDGFQTHNMKFTGETAVDDRETTPLESDFNLRDDFAQDLADTRPDINVVEKPPVPVAEEPRPEPVVVEKRFVPEPEQPRQKSTVPDRNKVFMWCLPATMRDRRDGMYGSKYQTIQYGKPFSCEGVIVEEGDMHIVVWTTVKEVTTGSILYPKKRAEGKPDAQRWWRVQDITEKNGGFVMTGYPSDHTPSFDSVD